ncbi:MAG: cytochrome c biogenesis protein CcsA [Rubrobacteridae bacterium]|nr:cytochrome c biogenesis protein CcsA [Rubrobacteridae bacterium]
MKKAVDVLLVVAAVLLIAGAAMAFFYAPMAFDPRSGNQVLHQKIIYFHMPVAETSLIAFIVAAVFGGLFLKTRDRKYDFLSLAGVELGFTFGILVMMTGMLWDKAAWNTWWMWEPRLTTYFILMLVYSGYFVLRNAFHEESTKARFSAVYAIIAAVNAPLTFMSIRMLPENMIMHPVMFGVTGMGLKGAMLHTLLVSMFGMISFYVALLLMRYRTLMLSEEIDYLKNEIGG